MIGVFYRYVSVLDEDGQDVSGVEWWTNRGDCGWSWPEGTFVESGELPTSAYDDLERLAQEATP